MIAARGVRFRYHRLLLLLSGTALFLSSFFLAVAAWTSSRFGPLLLRRATTATTTTPGRCRRRRRRRPRTTSSPFVVAAAGGDRSARFSESLSIEDVEDLSKADDGDGAGGRRREPTWEGDDDADADGGRSDDARRKRGSSTRGRNGRRRPPTEDDDGTTTRPTPAFDEKWDTRYEELVEYKRVHGDCLVPQSYAYNPALGRWVRNQRVEYRYLQRGLASYIARRNRIQRLNDLGFVWNGKDAKWNERFEELVAFKEKHGHLNVPSNDSFDDGKYKKLASWIRTQRMYDTYLRRGDVRGSHLTPERRSKLESIGFVFDKKETLWNEKFERLKRYKEEHGHCNVPSEYEDKALARWVLSQRVQCKAYLAERRRQERVEVAAGDDDSSPDEDKRQAPPKTTTVNGRGQTKVLFRRTSDEPAPFSTPKPSSGMNRRRYELLQSIDFAFDPNDDYWWEQYASLKSYQDEHGPSTYPPHRYTKLGNWVSNQRRLCRAYVDVVTGVSMSPGETTDDEREAVSVSIPGLNEERIEALRDIDFCWLPEPGSSIVAAAPREAATAVSSQLRDAKSNEAAAAPLSSPAAEEATTEESSKAFSWDDVWDEL